MARSFSTGNYIKRMAPGDWTPTGAIAFWVKPNGWSSNPTPATGADHCIFRLHQLTPGAVFDFSRQQASGNMFVGWYSAGEARIITSDSGFFSASVWAHHVVHWQASGEPPYGPITVWYINGTQVAFTTAAFTIPSGMDELRIGADVVGSVGADADIAEFARWDHLLSDPQIAALVAGWRPSSTEAGLSTGLLRYVPILGDNSPEPELITNADMTLVGTPAQATHPALLSSTNLKTINGLANASCKTVNGLALASVKTWGGLA